MPEKMELVGGKLFGTDEDRLVVLGFLLENVGPEGVVPIPCPETELTLPQIYEGLDEVSQ